MKLDRFVEAALFLGAGLCFALTIDWARPEVPSFDPRSRETDSLRVMTWNVGSPAGRGGQSMRAEYRERVVRSLRAADPDLCFLQEVGGPAQVEALRHDLGTSWSCVVSRRVVAIAPRGVLERLELSESSSRSLAIALALPGRDPILAVGLHADAWSSRRRNEQIGAAARALSAYPSEQPKLLVGDLNLDVDHRGDLFSDDAHLDLETYNFVAKTWRDAGSRSGPTAEPDRRLDYIFVDPQRFEVLQAGPWSEQRVGDMDHDPLIVDLRVIEQRP